MQIPRSYVENYSKALNVVSDKARTALVDALSQIDYSADVASIREAVIAIMQPACGASSTMAARPTSVEAASTTTSTAFAPPYGCNSDLFTLIHLHSWRWKNDVMMIVVDKVDESKS